MTYKVYAQGVRVPNHVLKVNRESAIIEAVDYVREEMIMDSEIASLIDWDDDDQINKAYEIIGAVIIDEFNRNDYIDCGDFCILESEEWPSIPNKCGYPSIEKAIVKELKNKM